MPNRRVARAQGDKTRWAGARARRGAQGAGACTHMEQEAGAGRMEGEGGRKGKEEKEIGKEKKNRREEEKEKGAPAELAATVDQRGGRRHAARHAGRGKSETERRLN